MNGIYMAQEALSRIMIENISEADLEIESMLTLVFKLHVATVKAMMPFCNNDITGLLNAFRVNLLGMVTPDADVDARYTAPATVIFREIFNDGQAPENNKPAWLETWIGICRSQIQKESELNIGSDHPDNNLAATVYSRLGGLIDSHFGIEFDDREVVYYLLEHVFSGAVCNEDHSIRKKKYNSDKDKLNHYLNVIRTKSIYKRIDNSLIGEGEGEIRLFAIARNESLRLPFFLEYYFKLGVDRIFLIDNNSTDNTRDIALKKRNVHVFKIDEGYKNHWFWIEYFLQEYGRGYWCMVVDIDELFTFPHHDVLSLKDLTAYLDSNRYMAVRSTLIDIYSDKPIIETIYTESDNPLDVCGYFEKGYYNSIMYFFDRKKWDRFYAYCHFGGVRKRVFGKTDTEFCLTKVPLFKNLANVYLVQGMHAIAGAHTADIEGGVFHTKYFHDFIEEAFVEAMRKEQSYGV